MAPILLASGGYDKKIIIWDVKTCTQLRVLEHPGHVNKLVFDSEMPYLYSAGLGKIQKYNLDSTSLKPFSTINIDVSHNVLNVEMMPTSNHMAVCTEDGPVKVLCSNTNKTVMELPKRSNYFTCMKVHPNEQKIFIGVEESDIILWDLRNNKTISTRIIDLALHERCNMHLSSFTINEVASHMAIASLGVSKIFKLDIRTLDGSGFDDKWCEPFDACKFNNVHIPKCLYSPDSSLLAACYSNGKVVLFTTNDNNLFCTLSDTSFDSWTLDCVFTHDSRYLLSACDDGIIRLWSVDDKIKLRDLSGHKGCVTCVAYRDEHVIEQ